MMRADGAVDAGEGEVDAFTRECGFLGAGFNGETALFDLGLDMRAEFV